MPEDAATVGAASAIDRGFGQARDGAEDLVACRDQVLVMFCRGNLLDYGGLLLYDCSIEKR